MRGFPQNDSWDSLPIATRFAQPSGVAASRVRCSYFLTFLPRTPSTSGSASSSSTVTVLCSKRSPMARYASQLCRTKSET